jgi:hypothetical protein
MLDSNLKLPVGIASKREAAHHRQGDQGCEKEVFGGPPGVHRALLFL